MKKNILAFYLLQSDVWNVIFTPIKTILGPVLVGFSAAVICFQTEARNQFKRCGWFTLQPVPSRPHGVTAGGGGGNGGGRGPVQ